MNCAVPRAQGSSQSQKIPEKNSSVNKNKSKSLSNLSFVQFMLKELFNKNICHIDLQKEFGTLRNCIMHSGGIIRKESDILGLGNIILELSLKPKIVEIIILDELGYNKIFGFSLHIIMELKSE